MNFIRRISITLAVCIYLVLPATAQKNAPALQRVFTRGYTQASTALPPSIEILKITNLPARPSIHILLDVPAAPRVKNSIRLVSPRQARSLVYKTKEHKMFVPRDLVNQTKALYRGMAITNIDELKNILINGLETNKSNFEKKIFAAYDPLIAVLYAQPTHLFNPQANLPVLIKIPLTPGLEKYASDQFKTARAFRQNIPAKLIGDVWILLEVNKKVDWYKVALEDGEVILFPTHSQLQDIP